VKDRKGEIEPDTIERKKSKCKQTHKERKEYRFVTFEVLTALEMPIMTFWIVRSCVLVGGNQRFG
jgi:hypothetical protein